MSASAPGSGEYLSAEGKRRLEERVAALEARLSELRAVLEGGGRSAELVAESVRATRELDELRTTLDNALPIESISDDPRVVKLGDTVEIRLDDGTEERYVIVQATEAAVDDAWISVDSPLARALIGQRVGAHVEIPAPSGAYGCTVVRSDRGTGTAR